MSFEKLQIRDFRLHKKLNIVFGEGITTIVGPSFAGKSTAVKALKWVGTNQPAGDSVISWDADRASVRLVVDGKKVIRSKGGGINSYKLDGQEYAAFGMKTVPGDIAKLLNLSDINFQGQFATHFWFSETAGEVSRQLNKIVNLEVIDRALANIASELDRTRKTIKIVEERLDKINGREKELSFAEDLDSGLIGVEERQKQYQENARGLAVIKELLELVAKYRRTEENAREASLVGQTAISKGILFQKTSESVNTLQKLVGDGKKFGDVIKTSPPSLKSVEDLMLGMEEVILQVERLKLIIDTVKSKGQEVCQRKQEMTKVEIEFKKLVGKTCPLCGSKMTG